MTKKTKRTSPIFLDDMPKENAYNTYTRSRRRRIVFGWYGGKFSHLDWAASASARVPSLLRAVCRFRGSTAESGTIPR